LRQAKWSGKRGPRRKGKKTDRWVGLVEGKVVAFGRRPPLAKALINQTRWTPATTPGFIPLAAVPRGMGMEAGMKGEMKATTERNEGGAF